MFWEMLTNILFHSLQVEQVKRRESLHPQQVSMILAKIVTIGKDKLKSVYDPTCGSGSLLLRVAKEVKK